MYQINETKMMRAAKDSLSTSSRPMSFFREFAIFLLVFYISTIPQNIIGTISTMIIAYSDPKYIELVLSQTTDFNALLEYMLELMTNLPDWYYVAMLASSGFFILGAVIYCKKFQKRTPFTMGFNRRGVIPEYFLGLIIGLVMISLPALACYLSGCVTFKLNTTPDPFIIVLFLLAFVLQGMGEEALFRGYLMTSVARRTNPWIAIIASALLFAALHGANPNFSIIAFINIALFGVFAGIYMLKRGSIWGIGAIHSVWNFAQSNIFGFNVSGNPKFETVLFSESADFGTILSGGDFGIEGGLGATVVLIAAIMLALLMPTKKSELCRKTVQTEVEPNKNTDIE